MSAARVLGYQGIPGGGERCETCGHLERYHGPRNGCHYPSAPRGEDCGCEALRTQQKPQSDETESK